MFFYVSEKLTEMMTSFQSTYDRLLETATKRMDKLEESCEMFLHLEDIEDFKKWLAQKQAALLSNEQAECVEEAMVSILCLILNKLIGVCVRACVSACVRVCLCVCMSAHACAPYRACV